jgi:hypothetical protein
LAKGTAALPTALAQAVGKAGLSPRSACRLCQQLLPMLLAKLGIFPHFLLLFSSIYGQSQEVHTPASEEKTLTA